LNKLVYAWHGAKNFCMPAKRIKSVIASMENIIDYEKIEENDRNNPEGVQNKVKANKTISHFQKEIGVLDDNFADNDLL